MSDNKLYLEVGCTVCGARPGEKCIADRPKIIHLERMKYAMMRKAKSGRA